MVTLSQIANGLVLFADKELLSSAEGTNKFMAGVAVAAAYTKAEPLLAAYLQRNPALNEAVSVLFANENSMIDIDALISAMKESAKKNGNLSVDVPLIGRAEFDEKDFDKLREYIRTFEA